MSYQINCPWCDATNALDFSDTHSIGLNEIECVSCEKPFHFESEPDIYVGTAIKTFSVKKCKCPECGFDYSMYVRVNTIMRDALCPGCKKYVVFVPIREESE